MHARKHAGKLHTCCCFFLYTQRKTNIDYSCGHFLFKLKTLPGYVSHERFCLTIYENTFYFLY